MERMPQLKLINSLELSKGLITRMRKTVKGVEMSILDVFVTCDKILPHIRKMKIDKNRENTLTNFSAKKVVGRVIVTDHNPLTLEVRIEFSIVKQERNEVFQFKDKESQSYFKELTSNTNEFTCCFDDDSSLEVQSRKWRKLFKSYFYKCF